MGEEFLPRFRNTDFLMHFVEARTSLEAMTRLTVSASKEIRATRGVRNFGAPSPRRGGRRGRGPNFTELWISVDPKADYDLTGKIQETVDGSRPLS